MATTNYIHTGHRANTQPDQTTTDVANALSAYERWWNIQQVTQGAYIVPKIWWIEERECIEQIERRSRNVVTGMMRDQ